MSVKHLQNAKKKKDDEYYTLYDDIETKINEYENIYDFKDKKIFLNCDDYR